MQLLGSTYVVSVKGQRLEENEHTCATEVPAGPARTVLRSLLGRYGPQACNGKHAADRYLAHTPRL